MAESTIKNHAAFIWSVADLLRGDYKQSEYGKVILPLTVIRRLDCVLEPTKQAVLERAQAARGPDREHRARAAGRRRAAVLQHQPADLHAGCSTTRTRSPTPCGSTSAGFSEAARDVIDKFDFGVQIDRLRRANLLYQVVGKFAEIDLHPEVVSNIEMGYLYEELIRKFSELSNETAGEHFTPREVIRLMVNLLFIDDDDDVLTKPGIVKTLRPGLRDRRHAVRRRGPPARAQPAGAAGGLRPGAQRRVLRHLPLGHDAQGPGRLAHRLRQLVHRGSASRASASTTCSPIRRSGWSGRRSRTRSARRRETKGFAGRFGAGLPRINDGSFLFLQHMISKMKPAGGGRLAAGDRLQRLAAVHRRGRVGRVGDPPLDHRERLAGGGRRAARPALLQHRHLHLLLGRHQPQGARAPRQGPARRRARVLREDAQVPGRQAQGDHRPTDRGDHPPVRRLRRGREGQDLPERGLRLPADHRRAAAAAAVGGHRRDDRGRVGGQGDPEAAGGHADGARGATRGRVEARVSRRSGSWPRRSRTAVGVLELGSACAEGVCGQRWPSATRRPR